MKIYLLLISALISANLVLGQENKFSHCNCVETLTDKSYKVNSNGIEVESGQFEQGKRTGTWISKNNKGIVIRNANYLDGKLDGKYELFHYDGKPKLIASFKNGIPTGNWTYLNAKGKIIKQGSYLDGKPTGTWKILDKKGKNVFAEYNFDSNSQIISGTGKRYFNKGGIARDDQSGEWMVLYFPARNINVKSQPLGGYMLASDIFLDYFNIPTIMMNTYAQFEFITKLKLENGAASVISVDSIDNLEKFDITSHSLPFMVDTNSPNKLSRVEFSSATIDFLKGQLAEFILITAPWITQSGELEEINIQTPIVINKVKKW